MRNRREWRGWIESKILGVGRKEEEEERNRRGRGALRVRQYGLEEDGRETGWMRKRK